MAQYEREFSYFPDVKITRHNFKDVDSKAVAELINKINSLRAEKKYETAISEIERAREEDGIDLSQYIVNAETFRTWEEEIYNTQTYAIQKQQCIYFDENEPNCLEGDVWIGD